MIAILNTYTMNKLSSNRQKIVCVDRVGLVFGFGFFVLGGCCICGVVLHSFPTTPISCFSEFC